MRAQFQPCRATNKSESQLHVALHNTEHLYGTISSVEKGVNAEISILNSCHGKHWFEVPHKLVCVNASCHLQNYSLGPSIGQFSRKTPVITPWVSGYQVEIIRDTLWCHIMILKITCPTTRACLSQQTGWLAS